jgi:lipid A 3-O-deacylase
LSSQRFDDEDLGCSTQFISHLGINLRLNRNWETGYRFEHVSNGGLSDSNPGLNLNLLLLRYHL